ncbi:hypothetical protein GCM10011384_03240 [Psychrobacillus lasiicapitis]|nr:hypothetical protein GCM10011384_03240 [Psychrobacillus lasiicapitis]
MKTPEANEYICLGCLLLALITTWIERFIAREALNLFDRTLSNNWLFLFNPNNRNTP